MTTALWTFVIFGFLVFAILFIVTMLWLFCSGPESEDQYTDEMVSKLRAERKWLGGGVISEIDEQNARITEK